jgi:hypothetical protein
LCCTCFYLYMIRPGGTLFAQKWPSSFCPRPLFDQKWKNSLLFSPKNNCIIFAHSFTFYILETTFSKLIIFKGRKEETVFSFLVKKWTWAKKGRSFLGERSTAHNTSPLKKRFRSARQKSFTIFKLKFYKSFTTFF